MKHFIAVLILSLSLCVLVKGQERKLTEVDLTVNSIRSGSSLQKVKTLGKPQRVRNRGFDECAGQYERTFYFPGLEIGLLGSKNGRRGTVYSVEVTSRRWLIAPGLRIGATRQTIISKFGRPIHNENNKLTYVTKENLGWVAFEFRRNKLVRASMTETLC